MSDKTNARNAFDSTGQHGNILSLGSHLVSEIQKAITGEKVKAIRITLGNRVLKEIPLSPATAVASVALVIGAILVSNLQLEVVKEALQDKSHAATAPGGAS